MVLAVALLFIVVGVWFMLAKPQLVIGPISTVLGLPSDFGVWLTAKLG